MHKRFTDIHKWKDPWFRKLPPDYKNLWMLICDECDNAGVWKVDMEMASYLIGASLEEQKAIELFNSRISVLRSDCWLITRFVDFQFGQLSEKSPLHISVLNLIKRHTLRLPYPYPSPRVQVKVKVKVKVKEEVKAKVKDFKDVVDELPPDAFERIWERYPRRLGKSNAEKFFKKQVLTMEDWLDINNALDRFKIKLKKDATEEKYIPHGSTWFNERWEDWVSYEEARNASNGGSRNPTLDALARANREAAELRKKEHAPKQISSGV